MSRLWDVESLATSRLAVLILNQRAEDKVDVSGLWTAATVRVLVDGGANHFWSNVATHDSEPPHIVCGDFDSISQDLLRHFRDEISDVHVEETPDQDWTDFSKALMILARDQYANQYDTVLALTENSGRLDHILASLETLFHAHATTADTEGGRGGLLTPDKNVFLVSSTSVTWLLMPGSHSIRVPGKGNLGHVGLIPLGCPASSVTTKGLHWNLKGQELSFGKLVSTSNKFAVGAREVFVDTTHPLLWTMEYNLNRMFLES